MNIKYDFKLNVDKAIKSAITSANTMKKKVQIASVLILLHAEKHGDYTKANALIEGLGDGVRRESLIAWFIKFGGLVVNEEDKCFDSWNGKAYIKEHFQEAQSEMWFDQAKSNPWAGFDECKMLAKVVKAYETACKKVEGMEKKGLDTTGLLKADAESMRIITALSKGMTVATAITPFINAHFNVEDEDGKEADLEAEIKAEIEALAAVPALNKKAA